MTAPGERTTPETSTRERSATDVERQTPAPRFAVGDPLPNLEMWVLERRLGGGGFGEVWLVRHERKGTAAVKFCTDPAARHKLVTHEKTVVARAMRHCGNHPNVVPLLECNLSGEIPWLMYEYVEGGTLADAVGAWATLPPPRRLGRAVRVLHALAGAHGTFHRLDPPLVHRDLKPQNVLMAGSVPRITDFGIGGAGVEIPRGDPNAGGSGLAMRVPSFLQAAGSSRYAPHEQILGSPPHPRDDVYALGIIAYQMIVADTSAAPDFDVARELRTLRIPSDFGSLIARSVALDPDRRPRDAAEWEAGLAALVKKKTASGPLPPTGDSISDDQTEPLAVLSESDLAAGAVAQTVSLGARGRWYARPSGRPEAEWVLVTTTPADVRLGPGQVYRFSIHSAAAEADVAALQKLSGLSRLEYLNLSFCAGVTDAGLKNLKAFPGVRQLYLRGCPNISEAGLLDLYSLSALRTLELSGNPQLSTAAVAALRKALPFCKIIR